MNTLLIGTYTRNTSEGIYRIELNTETETFNDLSLVVKTQNPTYLEYHKESHTLYSVYDNNGQGGIAVWNYKDGKATLIESITQEGTPPAYVHYDSRRKEFMDANYHGGFVNIYKDHKIEKTLKYEPSGKAHFALTHPKTGDLYTVALGLDEIFKYHNLELVSSFKTHEGAGPRHIVFHPTQPIIYLFTELSSEVIVLKDGNTFGQIQVIATVPEDAPKSGAAIRITSDGRFLYVSNRGHDSITVFEIEDDYTLTQIQTISTYGEHPRDFNINPEETHLVVANRDTNNLTLFRRNPDTGLLTYISSDTQVPEAVSIIFIDEN